MDTKIPSSGHHCWLEGCCSPAAVWESRLPSAGLRLYTQGIAAPMLQAHARGCTKCGHDSCTYRCYDLYDKFKCFSLCHGIKVLMVDVRCKRVGAFRPLSLNRRRLADRRPSGLSLNYRYLSHYRRYQMARPRRADLRRPRHLRTLPS